MSAKFGTLVHPPSKKAKSSAKVRQRLKLLPPIPFVVHNLSHDGRGVAAYGDIDGTPKAQYGAMDAHNAIKNSATDAPLTSCDANLGDAIGTCTKDKQQVFSIGGDAHDDYAQKQGKKVFISYALGGETVLARITNSKKNFEEALAIEVLKNPSPMRAKPPCPHFTICGGCSLQHVKPDAQIAFKQDILAELFLTHANVAPVHWLAPLTADSLHYRTKARLGVRYVLKKQTALVGFREQNSNFLADIDSCPILHEQIGQSIKALKTLISSLNARDDIAQLEVAIGQHIKSIASSQKYVAVVVRHLKALDESDIKRLQDFFAQKNWQLYLQPKGAESVHRIDVAKTDENAHTTSLSTPPTGGLFYALPKFNLVFEFSVQDFTQINHKINEQMTDLACRLLDLQQGERVLDLFCGLGNFSLPMARLVGETGQVIGVEGSVQMSERAANNAKTNGLNNAQFFAQDLTKDFSHQSFANQGFDAILIDPPRSGAQEVMSYLHKFDAKRIVYVSCNPITLARDTALIVQVGYRLVHAGVMDMFSHTKHVESIAYFEKIIPDAQ